MTRAAKIVPLSFEDFAPQPATVAPTPAEAAAEPTPAAAPQFAQGDIDAAFARGCEAGRTEAADQHDRQVAAQLAEALTREQHARDRALEEEQAALRAHVRDFLNSFCRRLAAERAAPLALSLIDRLLAASADRAPATLFVSEETHSAFGDALLAEVEARRAGFIDIACDGALAPGECRLSWRGGAAAWSHDAVTAAIDEILNAAAAQTAETDHERYKP